MQDIPFFVAYFSYDITIGNDKKTAVSYSLMHTSAQGDIAAFAACGLCKIAVKINLYKTEGSL